MIADNLESVLKESMLAEPSAKVDAAILSAIRFRAKRNKRWRSFMPPMSIAAAFATQNFPSAGIYSSHGSAFVFSNNSSKVTYYTSSHQKQGGTEFPIQLLFRTASQFSDAARGAHGAELLAAH